MLENFGTMSGITSALPKLAHLEGAEVSQRGIHRFNPHNYEMHYFTVYGHLPNYSALFVL